MNKKMAITVFFSLILSLAYAEEKDVFYPAFQLEGKSYSFRDVIGVSPSNHKKEIQAYSKNLTNAQLEDHLEIFAKKRSTSDTPLKEQLEAAITNELFSRCAADVYLASITDTIMKSHGLRDEDLEKYFDIDGIDKSIRYQIDYLKFLQKNSSKNSDKLYDDITLKYNLRREEKYWKNSFEVSSKYMWFMKWEVRRLESMHALGVLKKAVVTHFLAKHTCVSGLYRKKAAELLTLRDSQPVILTFEHFEGDDALLSEYLGLIGNQTSTVAWGGVNKLKELLRNYDVGLRLGKSMYDIKNNHNEVTKKLGFPWRDGQNVSVMFPTIPHKHIDGTSSNHVFLNHTAYKLFSQRFKPKIKFMYSEFDSKVKNPFFNSMRSLLEIDSRKLYFPDVQVDNFVKKEYEDEIYVEFDKYRPVLQNIVFHVCIFRLNNIIEHKAKAIELINSLQSDTKYVKNFASTLKDALVPTK